MKSFGGIRSSSSIFARVRQRSPRQNSDQDRYHTLQITVDAEFVAEGTAGAGAAFGGFCGPPVSLLLRRRGIRQRVEQLHKDFFFPAARLQSKGERKMF